jgi:hypothetical protein
MLKVKGVYDGARVVLTEPLPLPPNSTVEVLVPEPSTDREEIYWRQLLDLGLVKNIRPQPTDAQAFTPVHVTGAPLSQTIIEERR